MALKVSTQFLLVNYCCRFFFFFPYLFYKKEYKKPPLGTG